MRDIAFFKYKSYHIYGMFLSGIILIIFYIYLFLNYNYYILLRRETDYWTLDTYFITFTTLLAVIIFTLIAKKSYELKDAKILRFVNYNLSLAEINVFVINELKRKYNIELKSVTKNRFINGNTYEYKIKDSNTIIKVTPFYIMIKNDDDSIEKSILNAILNIIQRIYNKECDYFIDMKKLSEIKRKMIFKESAEKWKKIVIGRRIIKAINIILVLSWVPVSIVSFQMNLINSESIWDSVTVMWIIYVSLFLIFYNALIQLYPDLSKYRQRFVITKEVICPPWRKPFYCEHNRTARNIDYKKENVCIPIQKIRKVFLGDRIINKLEGVKREVWIIETVDGCEYYVLPKFKYDFLEILNQIAVKECKEST